MSYKIGFAYGKAEVTLKQLCGDGGFPTASEQMTKTCLPVLQAITYQHSMSVLCNLMILLHIDMLTCKWLSDPGTRMIGSIHLISRAYGCKHAVTKYCSIWSWTQRYLFILPGFKYLLHNAVKMGIPVWWAIYIRHQSTAAQSGNCFQLPGSMFFKKLLSFI